MKLVIQRVTHAKVLVNDEVVGAIDQGFMILAGVVQGDSRAIVEKLAKKTAKLRIFSDENGKTNRSLLDIQGSALVVSQFTLCADTRKGNRPSFIQAAPPEEASNLVDYFVDQLKENGVNQVETGVFGANMQVELCNSGPFTIVLEETG